MIDQIVATGEFKIVCIREVSGDEYHRRTLSPNDDISGESDEVKAVCNAAWTDEVKAAYSAALEA